MIRNIVTDKARKEKKKKAHAMLASEQVQIAPKRLVILQRGSRPRRTISETSPVSGNPIFY